MKKSSLPLLVFALALPSAVKAEGEPTPEMVKRGEYLVSTSGCHDCHTPFRMGDAGPEPDIERILSGHPESLEITAPAALVEPWGLAASWTNTAWSGPWGVSFTANLTPDPETGVLRDYSKDQFIQAMRTGRHLGLGRPILPPMPWPAYSQMTDDDLGAIYVYLRQIPAIRNRVPEPLPPAPAGN